MKLNLVGTITLATIGVTLAAAGGAVGQAPPKSDEAIASQKVNLTLENADLRYAIKLLLKRASANYTLTSAVQGTVNADFTDVPLNVALENLLKSADSAQPLTFRVENHIYNIEARFSAPNTVIAVPQEPVVSASEAPRIQKIQLNFADVVDIANAFGGRVIYSRFGGPMGAIIPGNTGAGANQFGNGSGAPGTRGQPSGSTGSSGNGVGAGSGRGGFPGAGSGFQGPGNTVVIPPRGG